MPKSDLQGWSEVIRQQGDRMVEKQREREALEKLEWGNSNAEIFDMGRNTGNPEFPIQVRLDVKGRGHIVAEFSIIDPGSSISMEKAKKLAQEITRLITHWSWAE